MVALFRTRGKRLKLLGLLYGVMWAHSPDWAFKSFNGIVYVAERVLQISSIYGLCNSLHRSKISMVYSRVRGKTQYQACCPYWHCPSSKIGDLCIDISDMSADMKKYLVWKHHVISMMHYLKTMLLEADCTWRSRWMLTWCNLYSPCHGYNLDNSKKIIGRPELQNEAISISSKSIWKYSIVVKEL